MENSKPVLTVQTIIAAPVTETWQRWTTAADIMQWNSPSAGWHTTRVENDLKDGGRFLFCMEAKDGSAGFDFGGQYDSVILHELITYTLADGRKTINTFTPQGSATLLTETFEPENTTPLPEQKVFCQGVLDHFKKYVEDINRR